jgi:hypothetical protein
MKNARSSSRSPFGKSLSESADPCLREADETSCQDIIYVLNHSYKVISNFYQNLVNTQKAPCSILKFTCLLSLLF